MENMVAVSTTTVAGSLNLMTISFKKNKYWILFCKGRGKYETPLAAEKKWGEN
jgi:hypothetical protein